jgi:hypothetical protein
MKKIILLSALSVLISVNLFGQIHSTTTGGYWNDPNTWVGGVIPGSGNDVVIEGPVMHATISNYNTVTEHCHDLTIMAAGSLRNGDYPYGSGVFPLEVTGNVVNNGTVGNGPYDLLKIFIAGNLENNNVWMPYQTEFQTSANHNLSLAAGKSFGSMIINNGSPSFTALTDMLFTCDFMSEGYLSRDNFYLNGKTFIVGNNSIELRRCLINSGTLTGDFHIKGNFKVDMNPADTMVFIGNITVDDTLTCNQYNGGYAIEKLKIVGDITNNGVVSDNDGDNPDDFSLLITGDLTNNGTWTCNFVNLIGTETQYIYQSPGKLFDSYFTDLDASSKVQALSDITIKRDFNLNGTTLEMEGATLKINGWLYNGFINNTKLHNGYLQSITSLDNLVIEGLVTIESNNLFNNSVIVNDTLQSKEYSGGSTTYVLKVDGDIQNNGVIRNISPDDQLTIEISGDINNYGNWLNGFTKFTGSQTHHISALPGNVFGGEFFILDSIGPVIAYNDLEFSGNWNFGRGCLDMQNNAITLRTDKWLYNGYLKNARLRNGMLSLMQLSGETVINGRVEIAEGNYAIGNITVNDTLCSTAYSGGTTIYTFTVYGNVANKGLLGQVYDDLMYIKVNGNIVNEGNWNAWKNCFLFYSNINVCSLTYTNIGVPDIQVNGSTISGPQADAFQIISGGGMQTIPQYQSYGATIQFTPNGTDATALLTLDCNQMGSLNSIELNGYNYENVLVGKDKYEKVTDRTILNQNYPNPFTDLTHISWQSPTGGRQTLRIIDVSGIEIVRLIDEYRPAGTYELDYNAENLVSGIYFYQLISGDSIVTKKMSVVK